jgi:diguanylate cyclase (GGDEF)-like protein/excisionase family DNA binding protein
LPTPLPSRPTDATLTVTKAARMLGVHPNTVRAWSDAGRLRYYRINPRGDRRYRVGDLQRFLAAAEGNPVGLAEGSSPGVLGPPIRRGGRVDLVAVAASAEARGSLSRGVLPRATDPLEAERHSVDLALVETMTRIPADGGHADDALRRVVSLLRDAYDHQLVAIWAIQDDRLVARIAAWSPTARGERLLDRPRSSGLLGAAITDAVVASGPGQAISDETDVELSPTLRSGGRRELAVVIPGNVGGGPWGVLHVVTDRIDSGNDLEITAIAAGVVGSLVSVARRGEEVAHQLHRAEALRRVADDIGSRLDLDRILSGLVDHAMVLFDADRAAVFIRRPDGTTVAEVSRGLSTSYLSSVRAFPMRSLPGLAIQERRPMFATDYGHDPRGEGVQAAVIQEGFDTICTAPLIDGVDVLGLLNVYHDRRHDWTGEDLDTMSALASQASVAIRSAQDFERMATWTAQLQSIQQLGTRLSRLSSVQEIGDAIATELRDLIDCHNVRVYRLAEEELIPVAMQGKVGVYIDETSDQLRVAVGEGITGWVAEHNVAQRLGDAANDPRADTIPGTEPDLDESMLLAPMSFDDRVLGVLVLSKLGLDQFTDDDLRLLVIYGSFAAQAMANADTTERLRDKTVALERQVRGQRELLDISESILTTLDGHLVLESITDRLERLIECDNIAIEVVDASTGILTPLTARGVNAKDYLEPWDAGETGVATWVVEHNEPTYIADERNDPRVNHFRAEDTVDGSLIVVPLRGRAGAKGVLTIERLGLGNTFSADEFDLVKLFAAQVSIALQNAEVYRDVELRAQTDALTGVLNHGTFERQLGLDVIAGRPFSLIMLDLDHFREVNNSLGHQAGSTLLRTIADSLVRVGRETDQIFRYGGDEFAILLPATDPNGAMHVAERAAQAVRGAGGGVSASIGIATYPVDGETATDMLLAADRACFVAKRSGRGRIATAAEGLALAAEFSLQAPTPIDPSTISPS